MNSQQLNCFINVVDKLSFSKAAKELYLSVPTITHHIKTLENELDTVLLIRDNHKVIVTSDGKAFYNEAKNILKIENDFKNNLTKKENKEVIRIACSAYSELNLIAYVLKNLKSTHPNIIPEIEVRNYAECIYLLKQQSVDVMLGTNNMIINEKDLKLNNYVKQYSYLIINKDNPLNLKSVVSFKDLEKEKIININRNLIPFYSTNKIKDYISIHDSRSQDLICHDELICLTLVESNVGVAILPEYRIPKYLNKELVIKELAENESFKYGLILNNANKTNVVNEFVKEFNKLIKTYHFR